MFSVLCFSVRLLTFFDGDSFLLPKSSATGNLGESCVSFVGDIGLRLGRGEGDIVGWRLNPEEAEERE